LRDTARNAAARAEAQILRDEKKRQDSEALRQREKARQDEVSKIARLRELRLAKEAAENDSIGG
jgi:hypothetical protein